MTPEAFLDTLEQRQLAPASVIAQLRQKLAAGDKRITADSVLKFLVKKEYVTRHQAQQLMDTILSVSKRAESSILGLATLPEFAEEAERLRRGEAPKLPAAPPRPLQAPSPNDNLEIAPDPDEKPTPVLPPKPSRPAAAESGGKPPASNAAPIRPSAAERVRDDAPAALAGPLLDDAQMLAESSADDGSAALQGSGKPGRKKKRKTAKRAKGQSEWDSPLLLLGGGGLLLLLAAGTLIYYLLFRENADAVLKEANEAFEAGSYTQAIQQYEHFVERFPRHAEFSSAKVRLGMTKLWRATEGNSNFPAALQTAETVIADIEDEPAFAADESEGDGISKAKRELSSLLTQIAKGLASDAEAAQDGATTAARVAETERALALCSNTKYVPQRFRLDNELDMVRETLARVEGRRQRDADLDAALAAMDAAIKQGQTAAAYEARTQLLNAHPQLLDNEALQAKVLEAAAAEQATVQFVAEPKAAVGEPRPSAVVAAVALARTSGEPAADVAGVAPVAVDGALYGLQAATGELLWRRYVGVPAGMPPLAGPGDTLLAVDARHGDVVCVEQASGKLRWRLPLEEPVGRLSLAGDVLWAPTASGRMYAIDPQSGGARGYVQFSQPIAAPVAASSGGDRLYVVGKHSNLYTLSSADLACIGVFYLGHAADSVTAAPAVSLNKVVVAENSGAATSRVRVLALDAQGAPTREVASARLDGLVCPPLLAAGRRLALLTTRGAAYVYEIGAAEDQTALTPLASRDATAAPPMVRYGLLTLDDNQSHLWVAGGELLKLGVLPTGNRLPVRSLDRDYTGDAFDHPLQRMGRLVIHVRRPAGQAGVRVAAMDAVSHRALWETELATPLAGAPAIDAAAARVAAIAASGTTYAIDRQGLAARVFSQGERAALPAGAPPLDAVVDVGGGGIVAGGAGGAGIVLALANATPSPLRTVELSAPLAGRLVRWRSGWAAGTEAGQVYAYDAQSGAPLGAPFQPELTSGASYQWALGANGGDGPLVVSDGRENLYALQLVAAPQPHLEAVAAGAVGGPPLTTPLAIVGARVLAGDAEGGVAAYELADLSRVGRTDVGSIAWGPYAVGEGALVGLETGELALVDGDGQLRWRQTFAGGAPVGQPVASEGQALVVLAGGALLRIDLQDGREAGRAETGEPAAHGPALLGRRAALVGADGNLLFVDLP